MSFGSLVVFSICIHSKQCEQKPCAHIPLHYFYAILSHPISSLLLYYIFPQILIFLSIAIPLIDIIQLYVFHYIESHFPLTVFLYLRTYPILLFRVLSLTYLDQAPWPYPILPPRVLLPI